MTWLALLISLAVLYGLLVLWNKGPVKGEQDEIDMYLEVLLNRGYDRGFLIIKPHRGTDFIQFSKYIGDSVVGLQFDFPRAPWSEAHYDRLQSLLRTAGFDYERQPTSNETTTEFLVIDLKQDCERGADLARLCLGELFGCPPNERLRLYFRNVSPKDERIGT